MKSFSLALVFLGAAALASAQIAKNVTANGTTGALVSPTAAQFRTANGLAIGSDVQAYDADLTSWAALTRATGFDTFAATPSSANFRSLLTDETGTGSAVFDTSPTLVAPVLGVATGTSLKLGSGTQSANDAILGLYRVISGIVPNLDNVRDETVVTSSGANGMFCSFDTSATIAGTYGYNHAAGYQERLNLTTQGTVDYIWGFYSAPTVSSGTTLTQRYGVNILDASGAGTVTTNTGLRIAALTKGSTNYAIFSESTTAPAVFYGPVWTPTISALGSDISLTPASTYKAKVVAAVALGTPALSVQNTNTGGNTFTNLDVLPGTGSGYLRLLAANPTYANASYPGITASSGVVYSAGDVGIVADGTGVINFQTGSGSSSIRAKVTQTGFQVVGTLIVATSTPASASATGTAGTICWDANYVYVCVATNTWKRVAISTW